MPRRIVKTEDVLQAVVRQALVLGDELTAHDVLEQIDALGRRDLILRARREIEDETKVREIVGAHRPRRRTR